MESSVGCDVNIYTVHCPLYSVQCTMYSVQCTVYSVQCTVYSVHAYSELQEACDLVKDTCRMKGQLGTSPGGPHGNPIKFATPELVFSEHKILWAEISSCWCPLPHDWF